MSGKLVLVSGPTAVGKDTLVDMYIEENPEIKKVLSTTTRSKRDIEKNCELRFISKPEFEKLISEERFLEYAKIHENYYGTQKKDILVPFNDGEYLIKVIDIEGMKKLKDYFKSQNLQDDVLSIFIEPSNLDVIRQRLLKRGTETPEEIEIRLKRIEKELKSRPGYDFIITSGEIEDDYFRFKGVLDEFYY
ncbi:MAG: guanylate kinase [Nanoarchaeota archaeon]